MTVLARGAGLISDCHVGVLALLALGLGGTKGGVVGRSPRQMWPSAERQKSAKTNRLIITIVLD